MKVRQLEPKDAEAYRSLRLEALQESPSAFASSYEEEKKQSAEAYQKSFADQTESFTFGAFEGSQLVGVVTLRRESLTKLRHRANLVAMYIRPEKRGSGLGKALVSKVSEKATIIAGIEQINLCVVTTNLAAKKLYVSCGFEVFGKEKRALKFGDTYYDEEHLVLFLKEAQKK